MSSNTTKPTPITNIKESALAVNANPIATIISELTIERDYIELDDQKPRVVTGQAEPEPAVDYSYTLEELKHICDTHLLQEYEKLQLHLKRFIAEATIAESSCKRQISDGHKALQVKSEQLDSANRTILELRI